MARKDTYKLVCNGQDNIEENAEKYLFKYSTTGVEVKLGTNAFSISAAIGESKKDEQFTIENFFKKQNSLFLETAKKVLYIYLAKNSKILNIYKLEIYRNEECISENIRINSLIDKDVELFRSFPIHNWNNDAIISLLGSKRDDSRLSAFCALLYSKSKENELERFMYLWIAINGMYGYYKHCFQRYYNNEKDFLKKDVENNFNAKLEFKRLDFIKERDQIEQFFRDNEWNDYYIDNKDMNKIIKKVIPAFKNRDITKIVQLKVNLHQELTQKIQEVVKNDVEISLKAFLIVRMPYHYRCKIFHADDPIPIFNINLNNIYKYDNFILKALNNIMEEYIDINLPRWFGEKGKEIDSREKINGKRTAIRNIKSNNDRNIQKYKNNREMEMQ